MRWDTFETMEKAVESKARFDKLYECEENVVVGLMPIVIVYE